MKKLKTDILNLDPSKQKIINNYLSNVSSKYKYEKQKEIVKLISLLSLLNFSEILNNTLKNSLKIKLLKELQGKDQNKKLSELKSVYIDKSFRFGNSMIILNNLLYYCEILNITNIYLNSEKTWPISHSVISDKINITLIHKENIDFNNKNICIFDKNYIYFQRVFKPEIRIDLLRKEIKKYLPHIKINPEDLFIHIRSGDIFKYKFSRDSNYAQPPLCFYQSILNKFQFRKVFILAVDRENPVINLLIQQFPSILFTNNRLDQDISILSNAYNIVGSISSFFTTLIIINDNLKAIWEYNHYLLNEKYLHLHHDIYKNRINYTIYRMHSSSNYNNIMFPWRNKNQQIKLMISEKCDRFQLIRP